MRERIDIGSACFRVPLRRIDYFLRRYREDIVKKRAIANYTGSGRK